jgi:hypothetical protein
MQDFPNYNAMNSCNYIKTKPETISFFDKKIEVAVGCSLKTGIDPTETMFRMMLAKIVNIDKEIKQLSCPKLKQSTFFNSTPTKQKQSSAYPSKKLKRS